MKLIYNRIYQSVLLFLFIGFGCTADSEQEAVITAARQYARDNSDVKVELAVAEIVDDYARVQVIPADPETADEATMYLHKEKGQWKGIIIGTGFSPEDYENLHIPEKIREKE